MAIGCESGLPAPRLGQNIEGSNPLAYNLNDLFIDNRLYQRVASLSEVTAGKWYFDPTTNSAYISDNPTGHSVEYSVMPYLVSGGGTGVVFQNLHHREICHRCAGGAGHSCDKA